MYRYLFFIILIAISGCSTNITNPVQSNVTQDKTKALVLIKTVQTGVMTGKGVGGFIIKLKNIETGKTIGSLGIPVVTHDM